MDIQQAIEHTKNKKGMKVCLTGLLTTLSESKAIKNSGYSYALTEVSKHFNEAREAWLNGELETVAEFFGLYVGTKL